MKKIKLLQPMLDAGVSIHTTIKGDTEEDRLIVMVHFSKPKGEKVQTSAPMTITGSYQEIEEKLAETIASLEKPVTKAFTVNTKAAEDSLKEIEKENQEKPSSTKAKKAEKTEKAEKDTKEPNPSAIDEIRRKIQNCESESELAKLRTELDNIPDLKKKNPTLYETVKNEIVERKFELENTLSSELEPQLTKEELPLPSFDDDDLVDDDDDEPVPITKEDIEDDNPIDDELTESQPEDDPWN